MLPKPISQFAARAPVYNVSHLDPDQRHRIGVQGGRDDFAFFTRSGGPAVAPEHLDHGAVVGSMVLPALPALPGDEVHLVTAIEVNYRAMKGTLKAAAQRWAQ